jgi:thiol-disulfide isomerase/thioredoxin
MTSINLLISLRKQVLFISLVLFTTISYAQKIIINPKVGFDGNNPNLKITKVVLTDSTTILSFHTTSAPGSWIRIPKNTYIQTSNTAPKLFIKNTTGILLGKKYTMTSSGNVDYDLVFPKINSSSSTVDYGEDDSEGWKIYDIELIKAKTELPETIYTEWYNKKNGSLAVAFYNKAVVMDKKVWAYQKITRQGNSYIISLKHGKEIKILKVNAVKPNLLQLSYDKTSAILVANQQDCAIVLEKDTFQLPILKREEAIFSGYIKNYTSKLGANTLNVFVDNNITGQQESVLIEIQANGYFYKKIPTNHFQQIFLRSNISNENDLYIEPGKELFVIIGSGATKYIGELAQLNENLAQLNTIEQMEYDLMQQKIVKIGLNDYKNYLLGLQKIENNKLDSVYKLNKINAKAYQIKKLDIMFSYANSLLSYDSEYDYAYRTANKLDRKAKVDIEKYPSDYFKSIIKPATNNEINLIAPSYNSYINRVKFLHDFRPLRYTHNYKKFLNYLKDNSYAFTANDKEFEKLITVDGVGVNSNSKKDSLTSIEFFKTHQEKLNLFVRSEMSNIYFANLDSAFSLKKGILLDLMRAQDIGRPIVEQFTPISKDDFALAVKGIDNNFVKNYLAFRNEQTMKQIEANKKNDGYFVNQIPNVKADQLFDSILEKYKGKVVLVDFWATWCGPCLQGIEEIKPLKQELKDDNVVFVYITNQTSPLQTYNNMLPNIKGQHYRVSGDEWNYLSQKFQISGIPHQVLVSKDGKVINPHISFMENKEMRTLIKKYL